MHGSGSRVRAGFASDWKTVAAIGFAAAGIALAGWTVFGRPGGERKPAARPAGHTTTTVDGEGAPTEAEYTKTRGSAAAQVVEQLTDSAASAAMALPGFGTQGTGSGDAFASSLRYAVGPLISGDYDGFLEAMRALGATLPGEMDQEHPLFTMLKDKLAGADVDLTRLEVAAHRVERGPVRVERREEGEGDGPKRNYNERIAEARPASLFGKATESVDEKAVDVRFPFRPKGERDEQWLGIVLVWNAEARVWQPGAFQMIKREVTEVP